MKSFNILTQYLLRNCNPKGQPSIIKDQNFEYQITIKIIFNIHMIMVMSRLRPLDTGRKLDVQMTLRVSSERLMYVQFTSCIQVVVPFNIYINKISIFQKIFINITTTVIIPRLALCRAKLLFFFALSKSELKSGFFSVTTSNLKMNS